MKKPLIQFLLYGVGLLLGGCAVKMPATSTFLISSSTQVVLPKHSQTHFTLLISPMVANPGYKKKQMVYVLQPDHLSYYTRHEWVAPPAEMLAPLIAEGLQETGYFHAVVLSPYVGKADYRLDLRLVVLQQEFLPMTSQTRCVIQAILVDVKTKQVVASGRFLALVAAPGKNPQSGARAANQAANQISRQLSQFVISSMQNR